MKRFIFVLAVFYWSNMVSANADSFESFGFGNESCASWTMNTAENIEAEDWLLGFWTGINMMNTYNHTVGNSTDKMGVIGEVQLICQANPSETILNATVDAYRKMSSQKQ